MNLIDQIELCEIQQDLAEQRMEVCYDEAASAEDPLWVDFNIVEGDIHKRHVKLWAATIGALSLMVEDVDNE